MALTRTLPMLLAAALAGACATRSDEAPRATTVPPGKQEKLQAAAHWQTITADAARRLNSALPAALAHPLYVEPVRPTAFNRAVANQLITWLVDQGHTVARSPADGLKLIKVEVDTQVVAFSPGRAQGSYAGVPTVSSDGDMEAIGASATAASGCANGEAPQTEIILNLSVADDERYLARSTTVYYLTDSDRKLYENDTAGETGLAARNFPVRGD